MRYLIVGDANSMHIFNYVKTVLDGDRFEVHLLTLSTERVKQEYRDYYKTVSYTHLNDSARSDAVS